MKNYPNYNVEVGLFSFKGRADRTEYTKIAVMIFLFEMINYVYFVPIATKEYIIGFIIVAWIMLLTFLPITVRRLHDSNLGGEYYLISLVPNVLVFLANFTPLGVKLFLSLVSAGFGIYFLYLVFRKGDTDVNNYGIPNPPKTYGNKTINFICILIFILIVGGGIIATR